MPRKRTDKEFGLKLREVREAKGLSVRELARRAGVHATYISKVELVQVVAPEWDKIVALANALDSRELLQYGSTALIDQLMETYEYLRRTTRLTSEEKRENLAEIRKEMERITGDLMKLLSSPLD